ncbi:hypothetical protein ABZV34_38725 [Streptomyces sp. NPDC005195]|uniref:hypothetical protein n=1 Tax=Streptomyces sp. NPDC005195 TaxID=3154561 RepID=UPI0033A77B8B
MERKHTPDLCEHTPARDLGDHVTAFDPHEFGAAFDPQEFGATLDPRESGALGPRECGTALGPRAHTPPADPRGHAFVPEPRTQPSAAPSSPHSSRLAIPAELSPRLGYDAVGTSREHGERIMDCLPRVGCVFADDERWWWIVPSGSQVGVTWPSSTRYAIGARLADPSWTRALRRPRSARPRLIHRPEGESPYTPPIPLYFLTCRLAGSAPRWSLGTGRL